jgi:GWxTD domain-containing protein
MLIALLLAPEALLAQDRDFVALRDSLAGVTSSFVLRQQTRGAVAADAEALLDRGFRLLRLYELTADENAAEDARALFERAVETAPDRAWTHYALAVGLAEGPELRGLWVFRSLTIRQTVAELKGEDARALARASLQRALEIDSAFTPAAVELAALALQSREQAELSVAREALVGLPPASIATLQASLALADVEAALGNLESAQAAAESALSAANAAADDDDDVALIRRLHAISLLRQAGREAEGAAAYFEGVKELTPAGAATYYADAEWLATDAEQFRWKTADLAGQQAWLREFWNVRSAQAGLTAERRLAEHYRRLALAYTRYLRTLRRGAPAAAEVLYETAEERPLFDDRGVVYIRYGEPDKVIATTASGLLPNETWLYRMPDGTRQYFHFAALRGGHDFSLIDNLISIVQDNEADPDAAIALFEDRVELDPKYAANATRMRGAQTARGDLQAVLNALGRSYQAESGRYRMELLAALEREHATPAFERELPFYYDVYAFKAADGRTELTLAAAVPGNLMEPSVVDGRIVYPLLASFIVIDSAQRTVARIDTVMRFAAERRLESGEHIRFDLQLAVQPTRGSIHRVVVRNAMRPGEGQIYGGAFEIPDYGDRELLISEVVLAQTADDGQWQRGAARLALLPPRQFREDEPFRVFYEIYNLGERAGYQTEITVEPTESGGILGAIKGLFGAGRGSVRLQFEDVAPDRRHLGGVQELRDLQADFEPGRYRINIRVTNLQTGRTAQREKMFIVLPAVDED